MKLVKLTILSLVIAFSLTAIMPAQASARNHNNHCNTSFFLGLPTWYKYLTLDDECEISGPGTTTTNSNGDRVFELDWQKAAGLVGLAIIEILLRLAAIAAVGFVILGGFRYITSQGEPDNTKSARQTIQNALIGLIITLVATGAVAFTANILTR